MTEEGTQQGAGTDQRENVPTRIGLLFVHGVGEQKAFHHLSSECQSLIGALQRDPQVENLAVHTETSRDGSFGAAEETWRADRQAPVHIDFTRDQKKLQLECHEVWWADLDDDDTLWNQVRFWVWGLGQWFARLGELSDADVQRLQELGMRPPAAPGRGFAALQVPRWWVTRFQLFFVGMYFFLILVTLKLANFLLSRLAMGKVPGCRVIVQYVGDVMLYQQDRWHRQMPPLSDLRHPPRVAIRRRVISAMVNMALQKYDRWYVCAHSLGTVVAYNGLMETAHCLPNYLPRSLWARCKDALGRKLMAPRDTSRMLPERPAWLQDADSIDRSKLFEGLRGFLTYGSPLDKFATLWPKIVPINKEECFAREFQWVNIYDPTDTIAGKLEYLEPSPTNLAYRAHWALLYSHLCYLQPDREDGLARHVIPWVTSGTEFPTPSLTAPSWPAGDAAVRARTVWATLQSCLYFGLLGGVGTLITVPALSGLAGMASDHLPSWLSLLQPLLDAVGGFQAQLWHLFVAALGATLLAGFVLRLPRRAPAHSGPIHHEPSVPSLGRPLGSDNTAE